MERSELESEIGYLLGDPQHDRWSTSVIRSRIEQAQAVIQAMTNAVKTLETLTPTADTKEVTVNSSTLDITRVTLTGSDGDVRILEGRDREDLDFYDPNWENSESGEPAYYLWDGTNSQLILHPKPSSSYAVTNGLKVWEVRIPTALTADDSEPFEANAAMQAYSNSIVHWVVSICWMDDGTPEALGKAQFHKSGMLEKPGEFEKYIKLINAKFDSLSNIPARIKWSPQGGRVGGRPRSKAYPFG